MTENPQQSPRESTRAKPSGEPTSDKATPKKPVRPKVTQPKAASRESNPSASSPSKSRQRKPAQRKPVEPKPAEPKPAEPKPAEPKPATTPDDAKLAHPTSMADPPAAAAAAQPDVEPPSDQPSASKWRQLLEISRPRATRGQLIVALLCGLLGFALVTQVHSQAGAGLSTARQADLVAVLDNLSAKSDQLRSQIADEQNALSKLTGGAGQNQAALEEAQQRAQTLRILAGTVGATGPGVNLRISDPDKKVTADVLLDALEELRDAGAEAVEIRGASAGGSSGSSASTPSPGAPPAVRLVASSYFLDAIDGNGVVVDGTPLAPPYDLLAIGDPPTLSQAMGIPGGVLDTVKGKGADATVTALDTVRITALHAVTPPKYAHPASTPSAGSRTPGGSS